MNFIYSLLVSNVKLLQSQLSTFSSVQSLSRVQLFATPWIAARQAPLSITNSQSSLRLTSIKSVMPSSHLILCRPLLLTLLKVGYFSLASFKIFCVFDTLKFYICEDLHLSYLGSLNFLEYKVIDLQYFVEIPWVFLLLSSPGIPILLMLRVFNGVPHFAEAVFIFFFNFYWSIFMFIYSFFFKFTWCWSLSSEFLKLYFSTPKFPFGSFFFFFAALHSFQNFPGQWSNPCPLQWKCGILTTGPPAKSLHFFWISLSWYSHVM